MKTSAMFFIFAVALLAPHLSINDAKLFSIGCMSLAVVFAFIEWRT